MAEGANPPPAAATAPAPAPSPAPSAVAEEGGEEQPPPPPQEEAPSHQETRTEEEKNPGEETKQDSGEQEKEKEEDCEKDPIQSDDSEEAAATAALQEEMKAVVASIPAGAGVAFSSVQLQELEQQSLIYRYMAARVPVPTHLVFPIWKSVTGASSEGAQKYPTLMGLATLCLDFGKTPDAEPGRCRRTDGKKWRCWRNAIPNEKYCERHMHRGRKRPIQLVVEDDEPDAAASKPASSASKPASSSATNAKANAAEGSKTTDDKNSNSSSTKKLALPAPAAVEST